MQPSTTISTSRCSDEPMAMQETLGELWATTSVPLNERRRLAGRLLALRLAQASGSSLSPMASFEAEQLSDYEDILFSAGQALGMTTKPTITAVKASLRQRGGHQLASRLGRLSKARNTTAHPDVGLRSEVLDVLAKPIEENIDTQAKTTKEATTPDKVGQWYAMPEPEQEAQDNSDDPGGKIAELTNTIQEQHKQIERLKQELEQQHVAQETSCGTDCGAATPKDEQEDANIEHRLRLEEAALADLRQPMENCRKRVCQHLKQLYDIIDYDLPVGDTKAVLLKILISADGKLWTQDTGLPMLAKVVSDEVSAYG